MRWLTRRATYYCPEERGRLASTLLTFGVRASGVDGVVSRPNTGWSVQKALEDARAIFACPYFELRLEERGVSRLVAGDEPDVGEQQVQLARVQGAGAVQVCAGRGLRVVVGAGLIGGSFQLLGDTEILPRLPP